MLAGFSPALMTTSFRSTLFTLSKKFTVCDFPFTTFKVMGL
ncbi:MAG: hypothetical protein BWY67_02181 [Bacteroidetes bacterium ADurb.Bin397]|nr:MAG: hypothetical protein BWY67_02181 [Bacteroidetes bacterium ADurb.Bin397]